MKKSELQELIREVIDEISVDAASKAHAARAALAAANPNDPTLQKKVKNVSRTANFSLLKDPNAFVYVGSESSSEMQGDQPFSSFKPEPSEPKKNILQKTADVFKKKQPIEKGIHPIFASIKEITEIKNGVVNSYKKVTGNLFVSDKGRELKTVTFWVELGETVQGKNTAMITLYAPEYDTSGQMKEGTLKQVNFLSTEDKLQFSTAFYRAFAVFLAKQYETYGKNATSHYRMADFVQSIAPVSNRDQPIVETFRSAINFIKSIRINSQLVKNGILPNAPIFKIYEKPMDYFRKRTALAKNKIPALNGFFQSFANKINTDFYMKYRELERNRSRI